MCDYSLYAIPNRLALQGEELVTHRFLTGSMGLASPSDLCRRDAIANSQASQPGFWSRLRRLLAPADLIPVPAVCVPPGAQLILRDIPLELQTQMNAAAEEKVTFVQTGPLENHYRDAVRFQNGRELGLQLLREGQRVRVVSLDFQPRNIRPQHRREPEWRAVLPMR